MLDTSIPLQARIGGADIASAYAAGQGIKMNRLKLLQAQAEMDQAAKDQALKQDRQNKLMSILSGAYTPEQITAAQSAEYAATMPEMANTPFRMKGAYSNSPGTPYSPPGVTAGIEGIFPQLTQTKEATPEQKTPASFNYENALMRLMGSNMLDEAKSLTDIYSTTTKDSTKFGLNPQLGINPETNKEEFFVTNDKGDKRFLGVSGQRKPNIEILPDGTVVDKNMAVPGQKIPVGLSPAQQQSWQQFLMSQNKPQLVEGSDAQGNPAYQWVVPGQAPGIKPKAAAAGQASEDERKAAGWVAQMEKGKSDMASALSTDKSASKPGIIESIPLVPEAIKNASRSPARQKFTVAASEFAEAALRAATGAGINESEAKQKIAALTPQWGDSDDVIKQKYASLDMYLKATKDRAGRALKQPGSSGGSAYQEYLDAYNRAKTPEQRAAITARARANGVVK